MQQKLENNSKWATIRDTQGVLDLLELIKCTTFKLEDEKYLPLSIHNAKSVYYGFNQGSLSLNDYREKFMNVVEIVTLYGNQLHDGLVSRQVCQETHGHENLRNLPIAQKKVVYLKAHNKYISCGFLLKANDKYGHVTADLENYYMKVEDHYPKNMTKAYKYLSEFNQGNFGKESYSRHSNHLAFLQGNPKDSEKSCYTCGNPGNTVRACPVCNSKKESKPAYVLKQKKEFPDRGNKTKNGKTFVTTRKKPNKKASSKKHAMGFIQLGIVGSCQCDGDVEMPDFNFSILGEEDVHQNPKVENRLKAHEKVGIE